MRSDRILALSLFIAFGLVFWRSQTPGQPIGFTRPYRFAGVALTWTLFAALAAASGPLAAAFAIGICVALALGPSIDQGATSGFKAFQPEKNMLTPKPGSLGGTGVLNNFKPGRDIPPTPAQLADPNADPNPRNLTGNPQGIGG